MDIDRARDAVERGSWSEAYDLFLALEPLERPEDRERFADAAWWTGRIEESIAARQKAYTGYAEAGNDRRAAWMAARLCMEHFLRDEPAVAGWQSGFLTTSGVKKPAFTAFQRLPRG